MNPCYSIIIPTYKSSSVIKIALESILDQTYQNFEVLIMDCLSTDGTVDLVKSFEDERIRIFSETDNGIYDAMNKGISKAKGEWIYFLGSDDYLISPSILHEVNEFIIKNNATDFVYGNVIWGKSHTVYDGQFNLHKLFERNICHQGIFIKKKIVEELTCFNIIYPVLADYDLNVKIFTNKKYKIQYINKVIAYFEVGGSSSTISDPFYEEKKIIKEDFLRNLNLCDKIYFNYITNRNPRGKKMLIKKYFYQIMIYVLNVVGFKPNYQFL